jgi:2-iminobutanoate/2-iminopropanoate deaminase
VTRREPPLRDPPARIAGRTVPLVRQARNPDGIHAPLGAYVHQIELAADERLLVLSGQVGMAPDGNVPDDPVTQVDVALTNLELNLRAAGMDVADLVKVTFYLVGEVDLDAWRQVVAAHLGDHRPAMTLLFIARLATPALRVEVDAWASAPGN